MSEIKLLVQIALRNLFAGFLNIIIGAIILIGTLLFVVGGSLLNSIDSAMSRSITGSVAGHAQVYSDQSKEELALFGGWGYPDIAPIIDFSKIKTSLLAIPNIQKVIPMGVNGAGVTYGNTVDQILEKLRKAIGRRTAGDRSPALKEQISSLTDHVRQMVQVIQNDYRKFAANASLQAIDPESVKALEKAASPEFWATFDRDPLGHLEFLENRIASLVPDADFIFLAYIGTDLDAFKESFDRMQVVDGQMVPRGKRGILLSKYAYERQFKLKTAYRLDKIHEALKEEGKKIKSDPDVQLMIKQNRTQTREIVLQLDRINAKKAISSMQEFLKVEESDLPKLLSLYFDTNDENFFARYDFFYKNLAPLLELYRLRPGDMITIKAFTKSGFVQSVNLKIYGTFQFRGLEKSGLAGGMSLMDLMSFRDLYGYITPERIEETKALEKSSGAKFVSRDQAEAELFGGTTTVTAAKEQKIDDRLELGNVKLGAVGSQINRVYSPDEIEKGVVLNAAIILKDPSKLTDTMKEIGTVSKRDGLDLRVATWQKAAGNIGQFVFVAKAALYFSVFVIFIVALVIINNAVMMATLQRVREIGTMRAIGAQRTFVLSLVVVETLMLGITFGLAGTLLGSLVVKWLGKVGIPAPNEFLYFFFSGPRLYVGLSLGSLIGAFVIICLVTCVSSLYPAIVATRVSPVQAMQTED